MRRIALILLSALALGTFMVPSASAADVVVHYIDASPVAGGVTAHPKAQAKRLHVTPGSNWYGWNWDHAVSVYDGTNNSVWDVPGAANVWSQQGLQYVMVTDPSAADVTVTQGDANSMCGTTAPIIGCTDTTVVNGEPVHSTVIMAAGWADWVYWQPKVGGTRHEFCHVSGFTHPDGMTNADSLCGVPIPTNSTARLTLSNFDRGGLRLAY